MFNISLMQVPLGLPHRSPSWKMHVLWWRRITGNEILHESKKNPGRCKGHHEMAVTDRDFKRGHNAVQDSGMSLIRFGIRPVAE
jgi:hypothetical protein